MNLFAIFSLGEWSFGIFDIVIVVILLLAVIVGLSKGFIKRIFKLVKLGLAGVAGYLFCGKAADFIAGVKFSEKIRSGCIDKIGGLGEAFTQDLSTLSELEKSMAIQEGVENCKFIPNALKEPIRKIIIDSDAATPAEAIGAELSNYIFKILGFLAIFIAALIILSIIGAIIHHFTKNHKPGFIDRFLGMILEVAKVGVTIVVVMFAIQMISSMGILPGVFDKINADMGIGESTKGIAKLIYENNPLMLLLAKE